MARTLGALLLALGACAWGLTLLGLCPARLGFTFSLMCSGLAWALIPWWTRNGPPDVGTPSVKTSDPVAATAEGSGSAILAPNAHSEMQPEENEPRATTAREHALRFCLDVLAPARTNTPIAKLYTAYHDWCATRAEEAFATQEIGRELAALFERTGVDIIEIDGTRFIAGARLKPRKVVLRRVASRRAA